MRKELTWEQYKAMLGSVPKGKVLVMTSLGKYYLSDKEINSLPKGKSKGQK